MDTRTHDQFEYLRYLSATTMDQKEILRDLMTAYGDDVWNFAFSICRKFDLAQDVTQDVFLKAYRGLGSFRGESTVKSWLLTITRNTALDYKKSAFMRRVVLMDVVRPREYHQSAEQEAIENMAVNEIWRKVLRLPAKYREVLVLFAHHQLKMDEIANILDINVNTVKSRLYHARMKILKMEGCDTNEAL